MIDTPMEKLELDNTLDLLDILTRALKDAQEKNDRLQRQNKALVSCVEALAQSKKEALFACADALEREKENDDA